MGACEIDTELAVSARATTAPLATLGAQHLAMKDWPPSRIQRSMTANEDELMHTGRQHRFTVATRNVNIDVNIPVESVNSGTADVNTTSTRNLMFCWLCRPEG